MLTVLSEPARRSTKALAESQTKVTATLVVATLLQMRAPTGKFAGPVAGLLLSSPMTFHAIGEAVNVVAACAAAGRSNASNTAAIFTNFHCARHLPSDMSAPPEPRTRIPTRSTDDVDLETQIGPAGWYGEGVASASVKASK